MIFFKSDVTGCYLAKLQSGTRHFFPLISCLTSGIYILMKNLVGAVTTNVT